MTPQSVTIHKVPQVGMAFVEPLVEVGLIVDLEYVTLHCPPMPPKTIEENASHRSWSLMVTPMAAKELAASLLAAAEVMERLQAMKVELGDITHATEI